MLDQNAQFDRVVDDWSIDHPGERFSAWHPFPEIASSACSLCPPSRRSPFLDRVVQRSWLLIYAVLPPLLRLRKRWMLSIIVSVFMLPAVVLELIFTGVDLMKTYVLPLLALAVLLLLVVLPLLLDAFADIPIDGPAQILFNVLLAIGSAVFSFLLAKPVSDREARKQWLPFAENACVALITIGCTAERMRRQQLTRCGTLREAMPNREHEQMRPLALLLEAQCTEAAERLASVRDQVRDARKSWEAFIRTHCDGAECQLIQQRLDAHENENKQTTDSELSAYRCAGTSIPDDPPNEQSTAGASATD